MTDTTDYMSDIFISDATSVQPGLIHSHSAKRTFDILKKKTALDEENRQNNIPLSEVETKKRKIGLSEPICDDNKGFEMLKKMGFEPGKGLGKEGTGVVEPVLIEVKNNREGLGKEANILEKVNEIEKSSETIESFRSRISDQVIERHMKSDLANSQRVCQQLDSSHGLTQPDEPFFWPESPKEVTDEDDSESEEKTTKDDLSVVEKLIQVTEYLREVYYYCLWCGTQFSGEIDLNAACPGPSRDDH